ncbi:MAG: uracil-DNA glycosylase family protein [Nitrospiraceae bacterium]
MSVDYTHLKNIHTDIAACCDCKREFRDAPFTVVCPPGLLYPLPPAEVTVLFVGVAPPRPAEHFYSVASDGLRRGLFSVLRECGYQCSTVSDFQAHGFYLSHTAKCPISNTPKPMREVCIFCSSKHLTAEIRALQPKAVCFLSKTTGLASCIEIAGSLGHRKTIHPGETFQIAVGERPINVLVTGWPGRRGLAACRNDLPLFLSIINK